MKEYPGFLRLTAYWLYYEKKNNIRQIATNLSVCEDTVRNWLNNKPYKSKGLNIYEGLDKMYEQAKEMGADAVMDIDISFNEIERTVHLPNIPRIKLSGFAIKRTE